MFHSEAKHVVVDLETYALRPNAVILSLGACLATNPSKYIYYEISTHTQPQRIVDINVLKWWEVQGNVPNQGIVQLSSALRDFNVFLTEIAGPKDLFLWSKGTDFDIPVLYNAMDEEKINPYWRYNNVRDLRTFKSVTRATVVRDKKEIEHNALGDCFYQARVLLECFTLVSDLNHVR